MKLSEASALRRLQENGHEELTRLFISHRPYLRDLIASRLHVSFLRRFDASDIAQEVFIRANAKLQDYLAAPTIHPLVWLRVLCKQILVEMVRKQLRGKRSPNLEREFIGDAKIMETLADSSAGPDVTLSRAEQMERVAATLKSLSQTDQEIIEMRHSQGQSFKEIAELLEIEMEAAKKRYYRAIDRFRDAVKQKSIEP
ncbi:MAG: RNA polymerase sigma factor [Aureliella sp.]